MEWYLSLRDSPTYQAGLLGWVLRLGLRPNPNDRSSLIGEPNPKDRLERWENLQSLSTTPQSCVESMRYRIIPYPLRNQTFVDGIHPRWLTLWLAFTPNPPLGYRLALFQVAPSQVALSLHTPALNESTNDKASSLIRESNPKDRSDRWENLSSLNTIPHYCVERMWDRIKFPNL